ncbi:hypothetical protein [Planomonospora parontospora]|nr:hypothetical protein [Planomonospora parontospora]
MSLKKIKNRRRPIRQQAPQQHRRRLTAVIGSATAGLILAGGLGYGLSAEPSAKAASFDGGLNYSQPAEAASSDGGLPPWTTPADPLPGIKAAGLTTGPMGTAEHYHAHLDIFIDGKPVPMAADIGIEPVSGTMTALHTHDSRGVIHIESHTKGDTYTLGQLFTQWGVTLTADRIGALTAGGGKTLTAYIDGKRADGDPAAIVLKPHMQVALVYGTPDLSFTPPAAYTFQPGE